jgi:hypothetical protein
MKQISASFLVSCLCSLLLLAGPALAAPAEWKEWAAWAETQHPITDAQGHGPDIGSDEWAQALAFKLGVTDKEGHGPDIGSEEWRAAVEKKLAAKSGESRDLLAAHRTEAKFEGIKDHRCLGRTALCPDECGHSGKLAVFSITKYLDYKKPGEYGDPKQESFQVLVEDNHQNPKVPEEIRQTILSLKPGDVVRLDWNHDYVTREGSKFPERPIVGLSRLGE